MEIEKQISRFVVENLLYGEDGMQDHDASFVQGGVIDSLGVMELVSFVRKTFAIPVESHEITPENFDSINRLSSYVRRKQREQGRAPAARV